MNGRATVPRVRVRGWSAMSVEAGRGEETGGGVVCACRLPVQNERNAPVGLVGWS